MPNSPLSFLSFPGFALLTLCSPSAWAKECSQLTSEVLQDAKVLTATAVERGRFNPTPDDSSATGAYADLPEFCRAEGLSQPAPESSIRFEIWMPAERWNGKIVGVGNGAWAGTLPHLAMVGPLKKGYAVASTDGGHTGSPIDASFAVDRPEKMEDFGHRAIHVTAVAAKALVQSFYGKPSTRALFASCSTGGRQGLMEAYRYPEDYDGISAMAPANPVAELMVGSLWTSTAVSRDAASSISAAGFDLAHKAALAQCDSKDGLIDGVISAPQRCEFDPAVLQCRSNEGPASSSCLSYPQVDALRAIYRGPSNSRGGQPIFPGFMPGSELLLSIQASGQGPIAPVMSYFRDLIYRDPNWDFRSFDFDTGVAFAASAHSQWTEVSPDGLGKYLGGGRKILLSHGWSDTLVPPMATVQFYDSLTSRYGDVARENARLFMIPGMGHCSGGLAPHEFDALDLLDRWVETGLAPDRIIASSRAGEPRRTRPLCPYPQEVVYRGNGDINSHESFECVSSER